MNIEPYENLQAAFNVAYRGLAAQGFTRSRGQGRYGMSCVYRDNSNNRKCAIGHLVPDELVNKFNNDVPFMGIINKHDATLYDPNWARLFMNIDPDALSELQKCHDRATTFENYHTVDSPELMREKLAEFAEHYGLTIPTIGGSNG